MIKRLQLVMNEEVWSVIEKMTTEVNSNFELGKITYSDVINEMILNSKIDVKAIQSKHSNLKKTLRLMASKNFDLDSAIKLLNDLKQKNGRKKTSNTEDNCDE